MGGGGGWRRDRSQKDEVGPRPITKPTHGTAVAMTSVMKYLTPVSEPVLCWIFRRNGRVLTCEVDLRADGSSDVVLLPHWDVKAALTEHYRALPDALLRHAEIARRLRDNGWSVAQHVQPDHTPLAA